MHVADRLNDPGTSLPGGLTARPYRGAEDHAAMAAVLTEARRAKGNPELVTTEDLDQAYQHLTDCEPELDIALVEHQGETVAYCRPVYSRMEDGHLDLVPFAPTLDSHRAQELFDVLLVAMESHLAKWGDGSPARFRTYAGHPGPDLPATGEAAWLEAQGYAATEWAASLRRPHLDDIPDLAIPDGIEVRPAVEADLRKIVVAHCEAFRGEWDFSEPDERQYAWLLDNPHRDETLWQVAWDGDEVVSQVKPFINHQENEERRYLRGYAEFISTHHDYRNRGLAGALLARALVALRDRGMTEAVLGVDTNNPGGALQLYTKLGFEPESFEAIYTKPVI